MLANIVNTLLSLLLVIIIFRESKKFSIGTSILCVLLGSAAVILQTIGIILKWT